MYIYIYMCVHIHYTNTYYPFCIFLSDLMLWAFSAAESKLTKTQRKYKKLKQAVNKADSLKILAYATASAIKRDGLKTTSYFDNAVKAVFNKTFFAAMATALGGDVQIQIRQIGNKIEHNGYNNK